MPKGAPMKRLQALAQCEPVPELRRAYAVAKSWSTVALALLLRDQCGSRPGRARFTAADTAHLARLLRERCEVKP